MQVMMISLILALGSSPFGELIGIQTVEIPHRVLHTDRLTQGRAQTAFYAVGVFGFLSHGDVEKLVCQTIAKEKPEPVSRLQISIYHGLDKYMSPSGDPILEAKLRDQAVAYYTWNMNLPKAQDRLTIVKDSKGQVVAPQSYQFDHTTMCK